VTRQQVARLLRKSVATVRRLEGVLLHPVEDSKGVWRSDLAEVEQLAADVDEGRVNLWDAMNGVDAGVVQRDTDEPCERCVELQGRAAEMESALSRLRRQHAAQVQSLQSQNFEERAKALKEAREFERDVALLLAEVNDLFP
jgi:hypothetical protein